MVHMQFKIAISKLCLTVFTTDEPFVLIYDSTSFAERIVLLTEVYKKIISLF